MPIQALRFEHTTNVLDLFAKLAQRRIIHSCMSADEMYSALMRQLLVSKDGNTYLLDDINQLPENEFSNSDIQFTLRNQKSVCNLLNFSASTRKDILFNAPLAKALSQIYAHRPLDSILFPLPVYEYYSQMPPARPTISHIGSDALLLSESNVYEDRVNSGDLMINQALDDLIWLRFRADSKIKEDDTEALISDIQRMRASVDRQLELCSTREASLKNELLESDRLAGPDLKDKSAADLRGILNTCAAEKASINSKMMYSSLAWGIAVTVVLVATLPLATLLFAPLAGIPLWCGFVIGAMMTAGIFNNIAEAKSSRRMQELSTTEDHVRHRWEFIKMDHQLQPEISKIKEREAIYKSRRRKLCIKEQLLQNRKEKSATIPLAANHAGLYPLRRAASENDIHVQAIVPNKRDSLCL